MTRLRLAAHRHFVADPARGRLLLQLAYVADRDAEALWDQYAWPPVPFASLPEEARAEVDRLRALFDDLAVEAARLGVRGGIQEAFRDVFALAAPRIEAAAEREFLVWEVAQALRSGAVLRASGVTAGPMGEDPSGSDYAVVRDADGALLNPDKMGESGAAAAFCGERGAGEEAARAALEAWESREERAA